MFREAFLCVAIFGIAFCVYMLMRNECIYRYRIGILSNDMERYRRMPSYNLMMIRFWVWPLSKFEK